MSVTINAFPPLHSMNSSRSWVLAIIVLLHLVFFWAFSSGLGQQLVTVFERRTEVIPLPERDPAPPPTTTPPQGPVILVTEQIFVPTPKVPVDHSEKSGAPLMVTEQPQPPPAATSAAPPEAVLVLPQIDSGRGLSEPVYPAREIRLGHAGTVILSVYVLGNGRIGEIRIEKSTGYAALDEAAAREARTWRLKPGTRDGVPVAMWKQIPITFQLKQ